MAVAPAIAVHVAMLVAFVHRSHWSVNVSGPPDHVPVVAVRTFRDCATPEMTGSPVFTGGGGGGGAFVTDQPADAVA